MNNTSIVSSLKVVVLILVTLYIANGLGIALPVTVTTSVKQSDLSVVGEGKVEVVPDVAYIDTGISVNNAKTVNEAQSTINQTNNKIVEAMGKIGVAKADIKTSNYSIYPNYSYEAGKESQISGYNGNVTITIKVKNTSTMANVIQEVTKAGANQIQGTRFEVDNPSKYREAAREAAIKNAKEQANKLSKSLGIKIGNVTNIVESNAQSGGIYPVSQDGTMSKVGGGNVAPQIEMGSQTVTSVVTLYFEKK